MGEIGEKDRPGFVYIAHIPRETVEWDHSERLYKIGATTNLSSRKSTLRSEWWENVEFVAYIFVKDRFIEEKKLLRWCCEDCYMEPKNLWWPKEYFLFNEKRLQRAVRALYRIALRHPST